MTAATLLLPLPRGEGRGEGFSTEDVPRRNPLTRKSQAISGLSPRERQSKSSRGGRREIGPRRTAGAGLAVRTRHQREEHAFAQAPIRDAQALARPHGVDRLEDRRAGEQEVCAV